jgi:hypothetical protein
MSDGIQIGTFTVTEPREVRETYETASWYRLFEVAPGTYPVIAYPRGSHIGHTLYVRCDDALCTASYFENRVLHCRSGHVDEDKGRRMRTSFDLVPYDLGKHVESGALEITHPRVTLKPWKTSETEWSPARELVAAEWVAS